jgi:signal transduction histidine kinase
LRSLRARLIVAIAAVLAAVLTAAALFSSRVTRLEFHRLEEVLVNERHQNLVIQPLRDALERAYRSSGSWSAAGDTIARAARDSGREILVVDPGKEAAGAAAVLARSPGLADAGVTAGAAGGLRIERAGPPSTRILIQAPGVPIRDAAGNTVGLLYVLPGARTLSEAGRAADPRDFAGAANRWLVGAIVAAGLAAVVLIGALARRLLGPIESLTDAARRMEAGDRSVRVPASARDELGELARSFNSMADAIELQETLRRNLVGDVAHELRTPLTNLRAELEALQDGLAKPDGRAIDSLHEDARLLERLVDDLQDLALAEAGRLALHIGPVPLLEAARRAAAAVETRARAGGVDVVVRVPAELVVQADRDRLGQILANLLGNALTHTPAGGRVAVSAAATDGVVETVVSDTGTGIAPEHLPYVFDRFYRTDPSRSRASGGTGLGLAIVRHLARAQGGETTASSEPGHGTRVSFTLPRSS